MRLRRARSSRTLLAVLAVTFLLAACNDDGDNGDDGNQASADALDLKGACPSTIVVQTSWLPDAMAAGALYHLLGPDPQIDAGKKKVTGALVAQGKDTGVKLELRAGGPAVGFDPTSARMYADDDVHLGMPRVDEQIQVSAQLPTLAVAALVETDPTIIMWDPGKHPGFQTIADIGKTDTKVVYVPGDTYMEYLVGSGLLKRSQVDGSQDGSPARFVSSGGEIAQAGYATVDPYVYEKAVPEWGKPIKFQLVHDTGYPNYGEILAIKSGDKDELAPCLRKLVPIVQKSQAEVLTDPAATIALTVRLNEEYKGTVPYTKESAEFAVKQARDLKLLGTGNDGTIGNFDDGRVQKMIDITKPIFAAQNKPIKDGLTPAQVYTNEFADAKIGLE